MTAPTQHDFLDKRGTLAKVGSGQLVDLELGCGPTRMHPAAVGVDIIDYPEVDVVGDALQVVRALPDDSVAKVHSSHFFEHLDEPARLVAELGRVVAPGGTVTLEPTFSTNSISLGMTFRF